MGGYYPPDSLPLGEGGPLAVDEEIPSAQINEFKL